MNVRRLVLGLLLLAAVVGGWLAWDWYNAPKVANLPEISLDGVDPAAADAVRNAMEAVRQDPQSGPAWGKLGMQLQANGFSEHISRCYEEAERLEPTNRTWPYLHGIHLLETSPKEGIALLKKSLPLNPAPEEQIATHFRLAMAHIEAGELAEGDDQLKSLELLNPNEARLRFGQGVLALAQGDRETARTKLSGLTQNPFIQKRASLLLAGLVDKDQSRTLQERANRLPADRNWPDPLEERMKSYKVDRMSRLHPYMAMQSQGRHEEAFQFLQSLARESPDREVCFLLGAQLVSRKRYDEADAMLQTALKLEPNNVRTHILLAVCYREHGEKKLRETNDSLAAKSYFQRSLKSADEALAVQPQSYDALLVRAATLKNLARTDDAIATLRRATVLRPDESEAYLLLGTTLAESGQVDEGLTQLQLAVQSARADDPKPKKALQEWRAKAKTPSGEK